MAGQKVYLDDNGNPITSKVYLDDRGEPIAPKPSTPDPGAESRETRRLAATKAIADRDASMESALRGALPLQFRAAADLGEGGVQGLEDLWQMVRHPIDTVTGMAQGVKSAVEAVPDVVRNLSNAETRGATLKGFGEGATQGATGVDVDTAKQNPLKALGRFTTGVVLPSVALKGVGAGVKALQAARMMETGMLEGNAAARAALGKRTVLGEPSGPPRLTSKTGFQTPDERMANPQGQWPSGRMDVPVLKPVDAPPLPQGSPVVAKMVNARMVQDAALRDPLWARLSATHGAPPPPPARPTPPTGARLVQPPQPLASAVREGVESALTRERGPLTTEAPLSQAYEEQIREMARRAERAGAGADAPPQRTASPAQTTAAPAPDSAAASLLAKFSQRGVELPAEAKVPPRKIAGSELAARAKSELQKRGISVDDAIAAVEANPDLTPDVRATLIDRLRKSGEAGAISPKLALTLGLGTGGALAGSALADDDHRLAGGVMGALGGLALANPMRAARGVQQARMIGMLSGLAPIKSMLGNLGAVGTASLENMSTAPIRESLRLPTVARDLRTGWTTGANPSQTAGIGKLNVFGRAMGAMDEATSKALQRAGLTPEQAQRLLLTAPDPLGTGPLAKVLKGDIGGSPKFQQLAREGSEFLMPFQRIPFNQVGEGVRSLQELLPGSGASKMRRALTYGAGGAGAIAGDETDNPVALGLLAALMGPRAVPFAAGAATTAGKRAVERLVGTPDLAITDIMNPLKPIDQPAFLRLLEYLRGEQ